MAVDPRIEVRDNFRSIALGTMAGWIMRIWCATLRYEIIDRYGLNDPDKPRCPLVYVLWHNRLFTVPIAWRNHTKGTRKAVVLTSASHDGSALANAVKVLGIEAFRGSSSRRAIAASVGLKRALKSGSEVCLTPDGPRGPCYRLKAGAIKLAQSVEAPVIPIHVQMSGHWVLKKAWDRFMIPFPFSRVRVIFDVPMTISPDLTEEEFEAKRVELESILCIGDVPFHQEYDS
jgi:lysophospholipid acyltransferase (LPLAT)-like uncharacterized protein